MTLTLSNQVQTRLVQEAKLNGISPEAYAALLLSRLLAEKPAQNAEALLPRRAGSAKGQVTIADDFDAPLDEFKEYTE